MAKISDSDTTRSYHWFLMEFCGLEHPIDIRITKVDLELKEISYTVRVLNAPGIAYKTQSIHGIFYGITTNETIYAKFAIKNGYQESTVSRNLSGTYPSLDWNDLLDAIMITAIYLTQTDFDRLFPAA